MSSTAVMWAELAGLVLWLASLVRLREVNRSVVLGAHVIAAGLSLALPTLAATRAATWPASRVLLVWLLGFLNGALGVAWSARARPKVSMLPMVGLTLGGVALVLVILIDEFRLTRLF